MPASSPPPRRPTDARDARRFWPLLLPLVAFVGFLASGLGHAVSIDALAQRLDAIDAWRDLHPLLSALGFLALYATVCASGLPIVAVLSIASGAIFGPLIGAGLVILGGTVGATALFVAARGALGPLLIRRAGRRINRIATEIRRHPASYLLTLRLIPALPFGLVTLAMAAAGIRLRVFAMTTLIGIVPNTVIHVLIGRSLAAIVADGGDPREALRPDLVIPVLALAALTATPILLRWRRTRLQSSCSSSAFR